MTLPVMIYGVELAFLLAEQFEAGEITEDTPEPSGMRR